MFVEGPASAGVLDPGEVEHDKRFKPGCGQCSRCDGIRRRSTALSAARRRGDGWCRLFRSGAQQRRPGQDVGPDRHRRCRGSQLATAAQLSSRLDGASITIIGGRKAHYYQPGFTLIAVGLKPEGYAVSTTAQFVPRGVTWIEEAVAEIDPEANKVVTASGTAVPYDYLVVATGLVLDYASIEGMSVDMIGKDGIGSVYAGPEAATATYALMSEFADQGGTGLFLRAETEMKCAGAPLKYTFITDDVLRRRGNRGKTELV